MMKKLVREWWKTGVTGLLILALGLVLRLYNLTILPVFADEAIYVRWAQVMKAEATLRFLPLSDGKQPLFMWMVIPFLKIIQDPLFAGRLVSALCGVGTLVGIFVLTYLLFKSQKASLFAAFIYAISPFTIFFDRMALADAMLSMFGIWTFVFGIITARTLRLDFAMFTGFALGGAYLTKSPALFFLLMLPATWFFSNWPTGWKMKVFHFSKLFFLTLIAYGLSQLFYNILRLGPNFGMITARNGDYIWPLGHILTSPMDPLKPFFDRSFEWIRMMGPWPILLLAAYSLLLTVKKYWKEDFVLLAWFLVPITVQSEFAKVFTARYILFTLPYLIVLASAFVVNKNNLFYKIGFAFFAGFLLLATYFNFFLLTNPQKANLPRSERSG
jgi:4-amino-4-deoxy-L-arabinose transferase-like glycosyltransferase